MLGKGNIIAAAAILLATNAAMAADSVDVKVIGTIVPAACKPALSGGATIDYGTIKASAIAQDDYTVLPVKSLNFSINCDAPAKVALKSIDVRQGTEAKPVGVKLNGTTIGDSTAVSGLGLADSKKIGAYTAILKTASVTLDGATTGVDSILSKDMATTWVKNGTLAEGAWIGGTHSWLYSFAAAGSLTPVAFTTLTGTLDVQAAINKGSELDLTKAVHLDGMSTIELYYL